MGEPRPIGTLKARCPACGSGELEITDYLYDAPLVGLLLLSSGKCSVCGYKYSDIRMAEGGEPERVEVRVEGAEDLDILVIKSSTATLEMPELGVKITPGPASQGFITTIEGILRRVLEVLEVLCEDPSTSREECARRREELEKAVRGEKPFTLVIVDPDGASKVVRDRESKEKLYETLRAVEATRP